MPLPNRYDPAAAVLKGLVERGDGNAYFNSELALRTHLDDARRRGWISGYLPAVQVTPAGLEAYNELRLSYLPTQGYAWRWDWAR